ncbi:uncharacterized protein LOC108912149 [Anoplophora glabripennis]|uniref:uncharacterized protein LOC108912149 n=1 Tax=Anoplophora glabripennis TaxID=217634 RepID=UPI00087550AA|nr:uncharacterized protein LOC108912149 [Anoplophora glabripennis]
MLRSIFSLIQNIIDSDREYSNKKSKTVIYLVSTPDNNLNMDLEIDGQQRENIKTIKEQVEDGSKHFKVATEHGDVVTCEHPEKKIASVGREDEKLIEEYKEAVERFERTTFTNDEEIVGRGEAVDRDLKKSEKSEVGIHDLWDHIPLKQVKPYQKERDQMQALMEQIKKMKMGMERLQEIAQQFNCSNQFKQDVEFLTKNVGPALEKSEVKDKHLAPKL